MATWHSRGLRGSTLEDLINMTNERYRRSKLALIQKIPTPIKPVQMDKDHKQITLAYFEQRSTVDYIGAVQGIPVCFDAKECAKDAFPLQNVHEHQIVFMRDFEDQGGTAFLLIWFKGEDKFFYLPYRDLVPLWNRAKTGRSKHFNMDELDPRFEIKVTGTFVHYLEALQLDLTLKEEEENT